MSRNRRIAYWISEKKAQKVNWEELHRACSKHGYEIFKVDLTKPLFTQEPFVVFLHKLTDLIALSECGDETSCTILSSIESYMFNKRDVLVIDPIEKVRRLLNRFNCYSIIKDSGLQLHNAFTPNFCEITAKSREKIALQMRLAGIRYPFICKPMLGHGSKKAHEMMLIFNEQSLDDCPTPCVAQNFVNHNAVLYKIFTIGEQHHFVKRPSLKNFYASNCGAICFESSHISKAGAQNTLNTPDPMDNEQSHAIPPNDDRMRIIAMTLGNAFGMDLLGIDVVIESSTGRYAIIDVNAYPGYDGFPNLYENLLKCIDGKVHSMCASNAKMCDNFNIHHESLTNERQLLTSATFG